jgi:repressor LexA
MGYILCGERTVKELSGQQAKVYARLRGAWEQHGTQPGLYDLARDLGIDYTTLRQHLRALETKGYLRFQNQGRGKRPLLRLLRPLQAVPVLGHIPAGPLSEALAHPEGYLRLGGVPEGYFGLYVQGDSMADHLQDRDLVLLQQGKPVRSGEICAVRLDHTEVTLKYVDWKGSRAKRLTLRPHNPTYPAVEVTAKEIAIDGVYKGSFRGEPIRLLVQEAESM